MKKALVLLTLSLCMAAPSFAAEHVVTHSVKVAGKDSYKVAAVSVKDAGKAGKAVVKFVI
jgi:uncharacterized GH25 family protein